MQDLIGHTLTVFLGFFAIMNPIANTPVFLALTGADDPDTQRRIARNALLLTFAVIVTFALLGRMIFELFGITLPAFQITGGVLVAMIGFHMLQGESSSVHAPTEEDVSDSLQSRLSVAISPG